MDRNDGDHILAPHQISGPWVEVDLAAITHNVRQIETLTRGRPLMPVVKANAYGHGLVEVARHLERLSVAGVCVGRINEALALRRAGIGLPILNLGSIFPEEAAMVVAQGITQTVFGDEVRDLADAARRCGIKVQVQIKVDTGLGRVGISHRQALPYIRQVAGMEHMQIAGIYTSLTEDPDYDRVQLTRFQEVCERAEAGGLNLGHKHAASSAGILENPDTFLDLVRPGIMVFGHYPSRKEFKHRKIDLKPALTLKARAVCVKGLSPGDSVAYHQGFMAKKAVTLVTGGIGYADGYPLKMAPGGEVLIQGRRYSLVASVTANHVYIDAGDEGDLHIGDEIVLIGSQAQGTLAVEELAAVTGRSEYQLLSGINPQLPKYYRGVNGD